MAIDDRELAAICFLALRVRKSTAGAGPWDEAGLMANLRKIQNRSLHMTVEHVLRHAADPKVKSPGVILGSFTPKPPTSSTSAHPPRREETCPAHPAYHRDNCGGCRADDLAGDRKPDARPRPGDAATGLAACREGLRGGVS